MFVKVPGPRHDLTPLPDGVAIRIPARRQIFVILFLPLWLCGWAFGEVMVSRQLLSPSMPEQGQAAFLILWLAGWTVGGAFAVFALLWQLNGREIVSLSPMALCIRREVFGVGYTRRYHLSQIRYLRVAAVPYGPLGTRPTWTFWGGGPGLVAFDYGSHTFRFGAAVDEAEARTLVQALIDRSPILAARNAA